jgi:PBP1b-binding outer membrane lipoprotein LpoB
MKIIAAVLVLITLLASCKSHIDCPAYSKNKVEKKEVSG